MRRHAPRDARAEGIFHQFMEGTLVKFARRFLNKSVDAILPSLIRNIWWRQMFLVREGKIESRRLRKECVRFMIYLKRAWLKMLAGLWVVNVARWR